MSLFSQLKKLKIEGDGCNYTAIAFAAMNRTVPRGMVGMLKERGDYADILQDARSAAFEAYVGGMSANEAFNLASRTIYAGMKACGYFRPRRGQSWEQRYSQLDSQEYQ